MIIVAYTIYLKDFFYSPIDYNYCIENHSKVCDLIQEYWKTHKKNMDKVVDYAYALIKDRKYNDAYQFLKKFYEKPGNIDGALYINYFIAKLNNGASREGVNKDIQNKIIDNSKCFSYDVIAAAYAMLRKEREMYEYMRKALKENISLKFCMPLWPVFDEYKNNEKFVSLTDTTGLI